MTQSLAERLKHTAVTANILDPGLVVTGYQANAGAFFTLIVRLIGTPAQKAARTYEWLALSPEVATMSSRLVSGRKHIAFKGQAANPEVVDRLWHASARLVGLAAELDVGV